MPANYVAVRFTVTPKEPGAEILLAYLSELPFESFEDDETGINAYMPEPLWDEAKLKQLEIFQRDDFQIAYQFETIPTVNWNEDWEKNFDPISIDELLHIRAPFHPKSNATYEIVIMPKMSFGTGHHETTHMVSQLLLAEDFTGKTVLDMGSGTAILAILTEMRGAAAVDAIDIDPWCYENALENIALNQCKNIKVWEGDAALLGNKQYDTIIANINRNILLQDMQTYASVLKSGGKLFLSGFYDNDLEAIKSCCEASHIFYEKHLTRNHWVGVAFQKL
ncbi:MAG: 50S ribosomal protein L11 methyltransferase [Flavobacteriaceae bacterium]|nr:50S ribosomal protein L11 methyltransferase [Flavobacteriaceae bacterium]